MLDMLWVGQMCHDTHRSAASHSGPSHTLLSVCQHPAWPPMHAPPVLCLCWNGLSRASLPVTTVRPRPSPGLDTSSVFIAEKYSIVQGISCSLNQHCALRE